MSHEIRTPLTIVNTYLYLLARLNEREKREWYMLQATERIMQLNQLLDKVLQMTKLDFGLVLHNQSVQLVTLLQGAIQSIEGEYQDAHAELRWHADTPLPRVNGDPIWLQEAFMELLKNAIKFTPSTGSITIQAFAEGEQVLIEIHDNGIGMNHEELTHIFERFWRQDEAHSTPGFGLGLPIAQQIIHLHHGTIHITSIPEQGTTVQVRLPRQS
jgi:signal transduction histidine kinase